MLTTNYVCSYDEYVRKMSRLILGLSFVDITPLQYANSMDGSAKRSLYCSISVTDEFCPSLRVIHFGGTSPAIVMSERLVGDVLKHCAIRLS